MLRIFKKYYPVRNIFFVVGECFFIYASVLTASLVVFGPGSFSLDFGLLLKIFLITFVCQICLYYNDLYDLKATNSASELGIRLLQALGFAAILLAFLYIIFPKAIIARGIFVISICLIIMLIVSWRFFYSMILSNGIFNQKIILLGSGDVIKDIRQENERLKK